jgi:hypothetical protein
MQLCPKKSADSRNDAMRAYWRAVEAARAAGATDPRNGLQMPYQCEICHRWHFHQMRVIDPNFRRPQHA